ELANEARAADDLPLQIRMCGIDARIDDGDRNRGVALRRIPCRRGGDKLRRPLRCLAKRRRRIGRREVRIVWRELRADGGVFFGEVDEAALLVGRSALLRLSGMNVQTCDAKRRNAAGGLIAAR